MKKCLFIGIVFLLCCLSLVIYHEFGLVNIHSLTNTASKKENVNAYLNATFVAGSITGDKDNGYYVIFGDEVQYIVYMKNKDANRISRYLLDNPDNSYKIFGTTKLIPTTMEENGKKFVKEWLDNNHHHEEEIEGHTHDITTEEFYHYFGYIYLDNINSLNWIMIIAYITGIMGILLIVTYFNSKYHFIG